MAIYIFAILVLTIVVGFVLPIGKMNPKDPPRCPKPANSDLEYRKTLDYIEDIPYCDEVENDVDTDEEWLYD